MHLFFILMVIFSSPLFSDSHFGGFDDNQPGDLWVWKGPDGINKVQLDVSPKGNTLTIADTALIPGAQAMIEIDKDPLILQSLKKNQSDFNYTFACSFCNHPEVSLSILVNQSPSKEQTDVSIFSPLVSKGVGVGIKGSIPELEEEKKKCVDGFRGFYTESQKSELLVILSYPSEEKQFADTFWQNFLEAYNSCKQTKPPSER